MTSQIAAGEVVERPASVVRELLDNSIDAASDRIVLRIEKGGKGLIRISDNGVGMDRDDLLLSIERHATSKIINASDLFSIKTMGFRGEALPSISAVSRIEITSRPVDQLVGYRLKIAGGRLRSIDETGSPGGTTVEVRDLFFNLPARRKFLRSLKTESDLIVDTLSRIALPFIRIHFRMDDGDRTTLNLPASGNVLDRLSVLLGRQVASSMIEAHQEAEELRIRAYLAPPEFSRSRGDRVLLYVNNRNIRDRLVTRAVIEGYGQRLMKGRYPQAVIFMEIDPALVDVNVHPAKQEIRFHNGAVVYRGLVAGIERSLGRHLRTPFETGYSPKEMWKPGEVVAAAEPVGEYAFPEPEKALSRERIPRQEALLKEGLRIIGQLKDTYILCQAGDGLLLIDQHAAHERIVYENLKRSYQSSRIERQGFLIPPKLEFSLKDGAVLLKNLDRLAELGMEIEHFGGGTFLLRSVPSLLVNARWEAFLGELIPLLDEGVELPRERAVERLVTVMACHGAIRAGQRMTQQEMGALIKELEEMDLPTNCPHGRPVFKRFTYYEIEKMFKRVV